jgi:hypothetical protein
VGNIPGAPNKCWITRNLGASQQATAVNDATEASAGWYWQFNRKQGYKHDGTTRTPNSTWDSNINEISNWLLVNDPCSLELGNNWRLPVSSELTNIDAAGNWTDWNGPWNSALKIHAAGRLDYSNGSLELRGTSGFYYGSTHATDNAGWRLYFYSPSCVVDNNNKSYGYTLRCVKD